MCYIFKYLCSSPPFLMYLLSDQSRYVHSTIIMNSKQSLSLLTNTAFLFSTTNTCLRNSTPGCPAPLLNYISHNTNWNRTPKGILWIELDTIRSHCNPYGISVNQYAIPTDQWAILTYQYTTPTNEYTIPTDKIPLLNNDTDHLNDRANK